jgi:hypothetical protein
MILPKTIVKSSRVNPKKVIIFSKPKVGKSSSLAQLENNLIVDLEGGTDFIDGLKINVPKAAEEQSIATGQSVSKLDIVKQIIKDLKEVKTKIGKNPYQFITLDTVTVLEEIVLPLANQMYRDLPQGSNWVGSDVRTLPNGMGYSHLRSAIMFVISQFESMCDTLILVGHVKRKNLNVNDTEIDEKSLDLTGKIPGILSADADAIGYMYREENKTILDFEPSDSALVGARPEHLRGKKIVIAECDENGVVKVDWSQVFLK